MAVTIKLRRTSRDFNTLTNIVPAFGEPVFYGEPPQQTDEVYYPFVIGNLSNQPISSLPRAAFFNRNIPSTKFFRGGDEGYPAFSDLTSSDIPGLPVSKLTSGTLGVARGGTGISSLITGGVLYGQSSTKVAVTAAGTAGQILMSSGTSAPYWSNTTNLAVDKASKDGDGNVITSTYVKKTDVANKGNSTTPVYFDSNGKAVALNYTIAKSVPSNAVFTDTVYTGINGISISETTISNSGVRSISTGGANGTISVNTNGTSANVAVKGLGSSAYTNTDYFTHRLTFVDTGGPGAGNWYDGTQDQSISYNTIGAAPSVHTHTGSQITDIVTGSVHLPFESGEFSATLLFSKLVIIKSLTTQKTLTNEEWKDPSDISEVQLVLSDLPTSYGYKIRPITTYNTQIQFQLPEQYRPTGVGVVGVAAVKFGSASDPSYNIDSNDSILIICSSGNVYVGARPGLSPTNQQEFMVYCSFSYIARDPQ